MTRGLPCPACGEPRCGVTDSRPVVGTIWRRRQCGACGFRFTTYESTTRPFTRSGLDQMHHDLLHMRVRLRRAIAAIEVMRNQEDEAETHESQQEARA
jgi:transcriptional regulator NrdR family protein